MKSADAQLLVLGVQNGAGAGEELDARAVLGCVRRAHAQHVLYPVMFEGAPAGAPARTRADGHGRVQRGVAVHVVNEARLGGLRHGQRTTSAWPLMLA